MNKQLYYNTGILLRFMIRRDRIRLPIWLFSITLITILVANAFTDLYATDQESQAIAETMSNPAMSAMVGQGYGLDNYTTGAMMAHQMLLFTALAVAIMSILLVTRHTRADEEDGRIEMIRSLPTGRLSNLHATVLVVSATNIILALLVGFSLYALQIESMDLQGSLLYGAVLGATGIFFTAITALFAQLSENARGTIGLSFTVLGIAYLIRAIGDAGNEIISWFSPLGWVLASEVYVNNYWWPIILTLGAAILLIILALYLNAIRDLESGFIAAKPGRKHASRFLQSPLGLTLRIQRTSMIAWMIGMVLLGASYGSVLGDLESFFGENEMMQELLTSAEGYSLTEQFIPMLMIIMAMLSTVPALMAMLKLKSEERKNRTEHLLGRAVSRTKLIGGYFFIAISVSVIMVSLVAIGLWSAGSTVMDDPISFGTIYQAAIVYLPAIWVMLAIALLLMGINPSLTGLTWLYLGYSFFVIYLGGLLNVPDWLGNLSPYGHIAQLPIENMDYMASAYLTIIAILISVIGFAAYRKRDIEG